MNTTSLYHLYCEYLGGSGKKEDAVETVKNILEKARVENAPTYVLCAEGALLSLEGNYEAAKSCFNGSIKVDGEFAPPWFELGTIYFKQKKYRKAAARYKKALKIDDRLAPTWERLGAIFTERKKYKKAEPFLKKSIEIDDKNANAWNALGIACSMRKDFGAAMAYYKKAIETAPSLPASYYNIALGYAEQKKFKDAEEYFKKAIELNGEQPDYWNALGYYHYEQENDAEAERCFFKALQLDENFPYPHFSIGLLLIKEKKYAEALKCFKRARRLLKKTKDKKGARAAAYHVKKLTKAIRLAAEQKKKRTLSSEMFLGTVKLYFIVLCIAVIILVGSTLYGILFGWTLRVIDWVERSLGGSAFMFAAYVLYYIIHMYRDRIPKSLHVFGNSIFWIFSRFLMPWIMLGTGIWIVPKMDLNFLEQSIAYVVTILITTVSFFVSDPMSLLKIFKQPSLSPYTFLTSGIDGEQPLKTAHISDIHTSGARGGITNDGKCFNAAHLKKKFDRLNRLEWDVLILTGDMTDAGEQSDWDLFCECSGDLAAKGPVIMAPGNHDIVLSEGLWVDGVGEQIQMKICRFLKHLHTIITPEFISVGKDGAELVSSRELLTKEMPFIEEYLRSPPVIYGKRKMDVGLKDTGSMGVAVDEGEDFRRPRRILQSIYPLALPLKKDFLVVALDSIQHDESSSYIIENAIGRIKEEQVERLRVIVREFEHRHLIIALHHQPGVLTKNLLKLPLSLLDSVGFLELCDSLNCRLILSGHVHNRHFSQAGTIPVFCSGASITYSRSFPLYTIDKNFHLSKEIIDAF